MRNVRAGPGVMKCQELVTCHMCCITDQWTDDTCALCGHAKHVPTIACVDMSQLGEILSSCDVQICR